MSSYCDFAGFYDELTENVEYEKRCEYIKSFFEKYNITGKTVLDLACGTCSVTLPLAKCGYKIVGVDLSEEMLEIASEKLFECGCDFSLIKANMTDFALPERADAAVCSLDSINHLNSLGDVKNAFSCVYDSLKENSIFVFDVNTIYKHNEILGDNTFIFDEDDYYIVWDNEHIDDRNVRILIDMFIFNGSSYDRKSEEFTETAYEIDELKKMLYDVGFSSIEVYDELTENEPRSDSERLYFVCKKD